MAEAGAITGRQVLADLENWPQDRAGLPPADIGWFPGAVYSQFLAARANDILQEYNKDPQRVNVYEKQSLGCVLLLEVRTEEAPCAPPSGCTWQRSVLPLPTAIRPLLSVTGIGGNLELLKTYSYREWDKIKYSLQARIEAERYRGYFTIQNNYIYVLDPEKPRGIAISGVFYEPVEVQRIPPCNGPVDICSPFLDYSLFIDPGKYQMLLASTFQLIQAMAARAPLDTTNNTQPAVIPEPVQTR